MHTSYFINDLLISSFQFHFQSFLLISDEVLVRKIQTSSVFSGMYAMHFKLQIRSHQSLQFGFLFFQLHKAWIFYSFSSYMDKIGIVKPCGFGDESTSDVVLCLRNCEGRPKFFYSHSTLVSKSKFFADWFSCPDFGKCVEIHCTVWSSC